jgi:hypothetical protein
VAGISRRVGREEGKVSFSKLYGVDGVVST